MSTGETLGLLLFALGVLTVWLYGLLRWIAAKENDGATNTSRKRAVPASTVVVATV
jgi:hypothetical protein